MDSAEDDLQGVVKSIKRSRNVAENFKRANSRATRLFLDAGASLLHEQLIEINSDIEGEWASIFDRVTRDAVVTKAMEAAGQARDFGAGAWNNRWAYKEDYIADLTRYMLRPWVYSRMIHDLHRRMSEGDLTSVTFGELVTIISHEQEALNETDYLIRLSYLLQTALPNHPIVRESLSDRYREAVQMWSEIYARVGGAYGLTIRQGYSFRDLAVFLNVLIDGVLVRKSMSRELANFDDGEPIMSKTLRISLPLLLERADSGGDIFLLRPLN